MRPAGTRVAAVVLALALTLGCKKSKDQEPRAEAEAETAATADAGATAAPITWMVPQVTVELVPQRGREHGVEAQALARRVGDALGESPHFATDIDGVPSGRRAVPARLLTRVTYGVIEEGSSGGPSTFVAVEGIVSTDSVDELVPRDNVVTERPLDRGKEGAALAKIFREQIEKAIDEMVEGILLAEKLREADVEVLTRALAGKPEVATWALELVAHRRQRALAPEVRALLASDVPAVSEAALATAVALGDQEAVGAMTADVDFQDYERLRIVIEASAALGGEEAQQFLEFVATGHADPDIKEHAEDALERLGKDPRRR